MIASIECPCGSGKRHDACCGLYLGRQAQPATAESLMRSRYSAYVLGEEEYLLATWHQSTRPSQLNLSAERQTKWLGLKVINVIEDKIRNEGMVEFVARYKVNGRAHRLHESSRFVRENGVWFYLDGEIKE